MPKKGPARNVWLLYLLGDVAAVVAAYFSMLGLRFFSASGRSLFGRLNDLFSVAEPGLLGYDLQLFYVESAPRIILILCVSICLLYAYLDLYAGRRFLLRRPTALNVIAANAVALALYYAYFYVRFNVFHPRTVFVTIACFNVVYCVAFRAALDRLLHALRARFGFDECRAVLVGSGDLARMLGEFFTAARPQGITVADRVAYDAKNNGAGLVERLRASAARGGLDMIVCADTELTIADIMRVLELSEELKVAVKVLSRGMDVLMTRARLPFDVVLDTPFVHFAAPPDSTLYFRVKRALSAASATLLLAVLSPLMLLIALLVRLTSRGPAFFVQERIGVNRVPFRMFKFRTMRQLADEQQAQVEEFNESGAGLFKIREDPRVTFVGRFLRRFSLDELPQLLNVIRGDMALVGPRPLPRRDFEHYYEDWHYIRHGGLPGLTCLWQVSGRSDIDFHNMCILDVYYLRNQSLLLDLKILLKTVFVVLFAKGAY